MKLQARHFELFSLNQALVAELQPLFAQCEGMEFDGRVGQRNNNQITSAFDDALRDHLLQCGATAANFARPTGKGFEEDFVFRYNGRTFVVEVEKSNRDKILYDFLKFHFYLVSGADAVLLLVPKNWPHRGGEVDLYAAGKERLGLCREAGFGSVQFFERTLIVGYEQATADGRKLTAVVRHELIAAGGVG